MRRLGTRQTANVIQKYALKLDEQITKGKYMGYLNKEIKNILTSEWKDILKDILMIQYYNSSTIRSFLPESVALVWL